MYSLFKKIKPKLTLVSLLLLSCLSSLRLSANTAFTGMRDITSVQLAADMGAGWNSGNSLDAEGADETVWGNPYTSQALVDAIRDRGFKTFRMPVTWRFHTGPEPSYTIEPAWLDRVEEVANYAFANDMYVIINMHHEDPWLIPTDEHAAMINAKLEKSWTQIANRFKEYGDYLIFETINEPRHEESPEEWIGGTEEGRRLVNEFHKTCVDAIRATGGNNATRHLMVSTYAASTHPLALNDYVIPNNDSRVIVSLHSYFPFPFTLQQGPGSTLYWGSAADKAAMDYEFNKIYNKFIANGRAVVMGEFGSSNNKDTDDRISHAQYYSKKCVENKIVPIWWDAGSAGSDVINRNNLVWTYPEIADALINAVNGTTDPDPDPDPICSDTETRIEAEDFTSMSGIQTEPSDEGGENVGYIDTGDWMEYCVDIPADGSYSAKIRVAAISTSGRLEIRLDGLVKTTINIPNTGWWQTWVTVTTPTFDVTEGSKTLRIYASGPGFNVNWLELNENSGGGDDETVVTIRKRNANGFGFSGGSNGSNGQNVYLSTHNANSVNQQWIEIDRGGGYYAYQKKDTDYCLDGNNGGNDGQNVYLWTCDNSNENQHWKKVNMGSGNFRLEKRNAPEYSIDGGNGGANGQNLYLWSNDNSNQNQHWSFTATAAAKFSPQLADEKTTGKSNGFEVSPNPVNNQLTIVPSEKWNAARLFIYDSTGRLMYSVSNLPTEGMDVNTGSYNSGMYLIRVVNNGSVQTRTILKR